MGGNLFRSVLVALVAAWVLGASMFQVKETELAIKFRLREIVATDFEPGLHFMIPWIETVQKFDRRVLTRNYPAEPYRRRFGSIAERLRQTRHHLVDGRGLGAGYPTPAQLLEEIVELQDALGKLSERMRHVLELRFGLTGAVPKTLEEVGNELGVTRERVRQLESRALRELQAGAPDLRLYLRAE